MLHIHHDLGKIGKISAVIRNLRVHAFAQTTACKFKLYIDSIGFVRSQKTKLTHFFDKRFFYNALSVPLKLFKINIKPIGNRDFLRFDRLLAQDFRPIRIRHINCYFLPVIGIRSCPFALALIGGFFFLSFILVLVVSSHDLTVTVCKSRLLDGIQIQLLGPVQKSLCLFLLGSPLPRDGIPDLYDLVQNFLRNARLALYQPFNERRIAQHVFSCNRHDLRHSRIKIALFLLCQRIAILALFK